MKNNDISKIIAATTESVVLDSENIRTFILINFETPTFLEVGVPIFTSGTIVSDDDRLLWILSPKTHAP